MTLHRVSMPGLRDRIAKSAFNINAAGGSTASKLLKRVNGMLFNLPFELGGIGVSREGVRYMRTSPNDGSGPDAEQFTDIVYLDGKYIAVGFVGQIWVSEGEDEDTGDWGWSQMDPANSYVGDFLAAEVFDGQVYACGTSGVVQRWDGVALAWEEVLNQGSSYAFRSMAVANGRLCVGGRGSETTPFDPIVYTSATGDSGDWSPGEPVNPGGTDGFSKVLNVNGFLVAAGAPDYGVGTVPTLQRSLDGGQSWTDIASKIVSPTFYTRAPLYQVPSYFPPIMHYWNGLLFIYFMFGDLQIAEVEDADVEDFERFPFANIWGGLSSPATLTSITDLEGNLFFFIGGGLTLMDAGFVTPTS
jgi:hypothetical protein